MFSGCSSLIIAPELPATNIARECYYSMFLGCPSLVSAPELPATQLQASCYRIMFSGCSSLVTAPELPATNMGIYSYQGMFSYCSKLNYVKHHIGNWNYASDWLSGVASSGTVECPAASTIPSDTPNGIPSGWTRINF